MKKPYTKPTVKKLNAFPWGDSIGNQSNQGFKGGQPDHEQMGEARGESLAALLLKMGQSKTYVYIGERNCTLYMVVSSKFAFYWVVSHDVFTFIACNHKAEMNSDSIDYLLKKDILPPFVIRSGTLNKKLLILPIINCSSDEMHLCRPEILKALFNLQMASITIMQKALSA